MTNIFRFLPVLFFTTACVYHNYDTPEIEDTLDETPQIRQQWLRDDSWWRAYNDADLNELVDLALQKNPDYLKAAVTINQELARLSLVTSDLFPTLSADINASSKSAVRRAGDFSSNFTGELGLNYEVDLYGKIRNQRTAQRLQYEAAVEDKASARLSLINSVTDLYFEIMYLQNVRALTLKNIESYEDIYKIAAQKHTTGKTDGIEMLEAKQSLLSEQNRLTQTETQLREVESGLRNILNLTPHDTLKLPQKDLADQPTLHVNLDVPTAVLAIRPDLKAAQNRLESAFVSWKASEKDWYPSVTIGGVVQSSSDKARTTFDFPFLQGTVGLSLPFLDWNRVRNNIKISEADYQLALIGFKDTLTQALNEIAYYDFAYTKSEEEFQNIADNYDNAVKITAYYKQRYQYGKTEFRYYLEALNRENSLREELIAQKYQVLKYENYIFKAMGGRYESKA